MFSSDDYEYAMSPFGVTMRRPTTASSTLLCQMAAHIVAANPDMDPVKAADAAFAIADAISARQEERRKRADETRRAQEKESARVRALSTKLDADARKTANEWFAEATRDPKLVALQTELGELHTKLAEPREQRAASQRTRKKAPKFVATPEFLEMEHREQVVQQEIRRIQVENQAACEKLRQETRSRLLAEAGINPERF